MNNPAITVTTPEPLCGQATRKGTLDAVTFDKEMVTCEKCLAILDGKIAGDGRPEPQPNAVAIPVATAIPLKADDSLKALMDRLDVKKLRERQHELEGELAALKILVSAAEAREKARSS